MKGGLAWVAGRHPGSTLGRLVAAGLLSGTVALVLWTAATVGVPRPHEAAVFVGFAVCGLVSGFLAGLLGIGGALVVVPCMYLLLPGLGVPLERVPHVAVGSSLLAMIPTSLAAARAKYCRGALDAGWLRRRAPGMACGAAAGAVLALQLRGAALTSFFAAQSLYYGFGLLRSAPAPRGWRSRIAAAGSRLPPVCAAPLVALFCTCAGMGGGSLIVPYLLGRGLPLLRAVATASALNLCIALAGAAAFVVGRGGAGRSLAPAVCWPASLLVGGCAVLSVAAGVRLAHRLPVLVFRRLLGAVTLAGGAVLLGRTWG